MSAPLDALLADLASAKAAARRAALIAYQPASRAELERKQAAIARPPAILAHAGRMVARRDTLALNLEPVP